MVVLCLSVDLSSSVAARTVKTWDLVGVGRWAVTGRVAFVSPAPPFALCFLAAMM